MILNINKAASQKQTQNNLLSTQSFLQKNKITVNQVSQTHYTVEGVQAYSPQQIKALKQTQQRKKKLQGTIVQVKVYKCTDYFDEFEEGRELTPKEKVQEALKNKSKLDLKNGGGIDSLVQVKQRTTIKNRDKVMRNNNVVVKLQKQRNKKSAIQQKLSKLSKQYKEYFKGSQKNEAQKKNDNDEQPNFQQQQEQQNEEHQKHMAKRKANQKQKKSVMYESLKKIIKSNDSDGQQQQGEKQEEMDKKSLKAEKSRNMSFKKTNQKAYSVASTYQTKPVNKLKAKPQKQPDSEQQDSGQQTKSKGQGQDSQLQDKMDAISQISQKTNKSTYSQKLGSAVHLLFL